MQALEAKYVRAIHRLRAGLPPYEAIRELTVYGDVAAQTLSKLFDDRVESHRSMLVLGAYGDGKSHYLNLLRELATESGYASCVICADGQGTALNHPQRFLPTLLSTIEIPGKRVRGFGDLLYEMLLTREGWRSLKQITAEHLTTERKLDRDVRWAIDQLASVITGKPEDTPQDYNYLAGILVDHLTGESIRERGGRDVHEIVYSLLQVVHDVLLTTGVRGIVLLIDEAESIFTKLPSITSRKGAYRVLAEFCESPSLKFCRAAIGLTPDAHLWLKQELNDLLRLGEFSDSPPARAWATSVTRGTTPRFECPKLRESDQRDLLERIRRVHGDTYPDMAKQPGLNANWERHLRRVLRRDVSLRIQVRSTIDCLDACGYGIALP